MKGEDIKRLREFRGLSRAELARRAGVSRMTVYHWENGTFVPSRENEMRLAVCLTGKDLPGRPQKADSLIGRLERLEEDFRDPETADIPADVRRSAAQVLASLRSLITAATEKRAARAKE